MFKPRDAIYLVVIVVAVGGALYFLSGEQELRAPRGSAAANVPQARWKASAKHSAGANAGFGVQRARESNEPLAGKSPGGDWPGFNGAQRDNKSSASGLLSSWPEEGPPLAWMATGLGAGFSTVSVVDGIVYTMGNKGESEAVSAVDAGTGEKVWSTPFAWASHPSAGDGPRSTPTVHDGQVFAMGANGDLLCLDAKTGEIRWQKNILDEFGGNIPGWGVCESVLVDQGRLICTPGGKKATIVALEPDTGEVIWTSLVPEKDGPGYASAAVAEVDGVRQYVQFTAAGTVGVRADDGTYLWRENSASNGSANCSSPQVVGNLVFTASNYGQGGALVKLTAAGSKIAAERVYQTKDMTNHHGDMVVVDGLLYGANDPSILTCLELETGKVKWQSRGPGKGSITFADGRLYYRNEKGTMVLVEATGEAYHELGKLEPPQSSGSNAWAHPVVAAGRLFLRDQDLLLCYDVRASQGQ